ncbi:beta-ketoacyl synthase chain length factor [Xenophilus arseniciresistens]|uniref:Beta-ketoacyl synthase chain length factor n=1 Tax=Xenophilus arseniciresistens TaxID=1283306 RepID=A0AAE3NB02_9BURK|nr:beta-ketoacyl synthase chain length factor [Xenophilus arseniciresistens]MDA7418321.1 beta-ketoacyl synthase chain length factor [Xenophilus arseniciresistens]
MSGTPTLYIEGPAFWAPTLPGWDTARLALRDAGPVAEPPAKRPSPQMLAAAERRRAPDTVAVALETASASVAAAGRNAAELPCVFASAHGDLAINDYMCATLATAPAQLSPIKFHNSVHNAAVGYWTIGTGCQRASNSLAAYEYSFASGLMEAAAQCACDSEAVLLVGFDVEAVGPLKQVHRSEGLLSGAFVLSPTRTERAVAALDWALQPGPSRSEPLRSEAARRLPPNAIADALPVFEALARLETGEPQSLALPLSAQLSLVLRLAPLE